MDQWIVSLAPGSFWAMLVPIATCAILIYAIERVDRSSSETDGSFRQSIRKERHQVVVSSSVVVDVEDVFEESDFSK